MATKTRNRCCYDDLNFAGGHELAEESTEHLPGSSEKIKVMSQRFEQRISLWHPKDSVVDEDDGEVLFPVGKLDLLHLAGDVADQEEADGD